MKILALTLASCIACLPSTASADNIGFQADLGVPDGLAVGLVVRPQVDWLRLDFSVTYNGLAPGFRVGATYDPFDLKVAPTLTAEGGYAFPGTAPGLLLSPDIGYEYVNLHLGLEGGKRDSWRLFLHAGPSWLNGEINNFSGIAAQQNRGITVSNPGGNIFFFPTIKIGFAEYF